jgi:DNA polymerase-3 subunit delta'
MAIIFVGSLEEAKAWAKKEAGIAQEPHPDLHLFTIEGKSGTHSMESMQQLIAESALPPFSAKKSLFILEEAHRMLPASSNSLLKTLEEPPTDCLLVLVTRKAELLLPTIASRCRKIFSSRQGARTPFDLAPLFTAAKEGNYAKLVNEISRIEAQIAQEEAGTPIYFQMIDHLFDALLAQTKNIKLFEKSRLALERNIRLRTILLNFFLCD